MKLLTVIAFLILTSPVVGQDRPIVIRAGVLLDGKGGVMRNATIVVQGSKILKIDSSTAAPTYDFRTLTVLPGLIDTHVHITGHFGADGRANNRGGADN
jgi:imidazolonepropionase-like amidohydrolase